MEKGVLTREFEGWVTGFVFPPLGDSMEEASGRAPLLQNLKDEVFEDLPLYMGPFGDLRGGTIVGAFEENE
jgi:hypothetical protein